MKDQPNINALWGALLIEELVRQGIDRVVIAPGSRSTPMVVAAARHPGLRCQLCVDERSAAFFALGLARGRGRPVAIITTSGTAVANLAPAVVEASADGVPLVLLTADRPIELRDCGANQTILQTGLFADHLRWRFELPAPDDRVPARAVLTAAAHAVARAIDGRGPVQLNCPFREPLAPTPVAWDPSCLAGTAAWQEGKAPYVRSTPAHLAARAGELDDLARQLRDTGPGLVIASGHTAAPSAPALARHLGWPLWADVRSGLRFGLPDAPHLPHLDRLIAAGRYRPRAVVQLGGRMTGRRLTDWLEGEESLLHIVVDPSEGRVDPTHRSGVRIRCEPESWCLEMLALLGGGVTAADHAPDAELTAADHRVETALERAIDGDRELSEPWVARWLSRHIPADHGLFVSSSLPIRDLQSYGVRDGPPLAVAANRGASGIDGVLSTAAGYGVGRARPVTVLIGDLALLHDLGSLALLSELEQPLIAVVLNNGGGSIFGQLPIAQHTDVFSPFFDTPHSFRFEGTARDFGVAHRSIETREAFENEYREAVSQGGATLLEVRSSLADNREHHRRIEAAVQAEL